MSWSSTTASSGGSGGSSTAGILGAYSNASNALRAQVAKIVTNPNAKKRVVPKQGAISGGVPVHAPFGIKQLGGDTRRSRKTAASRKMKRRSTHKRSAQHGGAATPLPLAYFQPGAFEGRTVDPTGVGLAGSSASWARAPLPAGAQMGGRRSRRRQRGGFSPSVMGSFITNGLRFVPIAGYMGYKMMERRRPHRRTHRHRRR